MSVLAAAFCPHPPLLLPELVGDTGTELTTLRDACAAVITSIAASGSPIMVLGAGSEGREYAGDAGGTFAPWGVERAVGGKGSPGLPLSLTVGAWLLDRAGVPLAGRTYRSLPPTPAPVRESDGVSPGSERADAFTLLVMADGSASRTPKAPAGFHDQAAAYDRDVAAALRSGDPVALEAAADPTVAGAVAAGGATTWRTAAGWVADQGPARAELLADEAPYGVGYFVALWTWPR